jgi:hypothetical protein
MSLPPDSAPPDIAFACFVLDRSVLELGGPHALSTPSTASGSTRFW